jgi:hypothetical protein
VTASDRLSTPIPDLAEIDRINALTDPVIRNLQITQCYYELSVVLAGRISPGANWCTFATWASKQAGQTIRKEDLKRLLEIKLAGSAETVQAAGNFAAAARPEQAAQAARLQQMALDPGNFTSAIDRASDAVGRGNKKVFEEIGHQFTRFINTCIADETPDSVKIAGFCKELRVGAPPDGQDYVRQAFAHYYQAMFEPDAKSRAELVLLANIEIGFHEQTRLQPEIAKSLDAGLISSIEFTRRLLASIFPYNGWLALASLKIRQMLGRSTVLDRAIQELLDATRALLRETITEMMMTLTLPPNLRLRLGEDLKAAFPETLQKITNRELISLLEKVDPTPDSLSGTGVRDWANLPDRLHFIVDLFRSYQEDHNLFNPPFTPEQVAVLKEGKLPEGKL